MYVSSEDQPEAMTGWNWIQEVKGELLEGEHQEEGKAYTPSSIPLPLLGITKQQPQSTTVINPIHPRKTTERRIVATSSSYSPNNSPGSLEEQIPTITIPIYPREMTKRKVAEGLSASSSSSSIATSSSYSHSLNQDNPSPSSLSSSISSHSVSKTSHPNNSTDSPSSSTSSHSAPNPDSCSKLQIIICSCSAHLAPGTIHIDPSHTNTNTNSAAYTLTHLTTHYPSLPLLQIKDLVTAFTPSPLSTHLQPYLALLPPILPSPKAVMSKLQDLDLPSRARKYIRNPLLTFGLANRTRIGAQNVGMMSFRLCFNIFVVVAWLLIRRFAEIFGVHLRPLSISNQPPNFHSNPNVNPNTNSENTVIVAKEGASWEDIQECGRERERARTKRKAWVEVEDENE